MRSGFPKEVSDGPAETFHAGFSNAKRCSDRKREQAGFTDCPRTFDQTQPMTKKGRLCFLFTGSDPVGKENG